MNIEQSIKNFCQNLRYLRIKYHLTQLEMAKILGVSVRKLRRIEECDPTARIQVVHLYRICDHFHICGDKILLENWMETRIE